MYFTLLLLILNVLLQIGKWLETPDAHNMHFVSINSPRRWYGKVIMISYFDVKSQIAPTQ